jgi:hypothetical protein
MTQSTGVIRYSNIGVSGVYQPSAAYNEYLQTTYIDTGKITVEHSRELDVVTTYVNFRSDADKAEFMADATINAEKELRSAFYTANGVTIQSTIN